MLTPRRRTSDVPPTVAGAVGASALLSRSTVWARGGSPVFAPIFLNEDTLTTSSSSDTRQFLLAIAIAVFLLGMLIGSPILGFLSDRFGRRRLILISITAGAAMSLVCGVAIAAGWLVLLLLGRFVAGLFAGIWRSLAPPPLTSRGRESFCLHLGDRDGR